MDETELDKGIQAGIKLAAKHCESCAKGHSDYDRPWHADALYDEADHLRGYAKTLRGKRDE
jgi:hypothetical protein